MSQRTLILNQVQKAYSAIRTGSTIPGSTVRFKNTFKTVSRRLLSPTKENMPSIQYAYETVTASQYLSDVRLDTMALRSVIMVFSSSEKKSAAEMVDDLMDDAMNALTYDPQLNLTARRVRIVEASASPEEEEFEIMGVFTTFIDYIEQNTDSVKATLPSALSFNPDTDYKEHQIMCLLFNACLTTQDIVWVERATVWPVPPEQIPSSKTPGIWFKEQAEEYEYVGSPDTKKTIHVDMVLYALETTESNFANAIDTWVGNLKIMLQNNADLAGAVLSVDLVQISSAQSKYPLIQIDVQLNIRYVQSFKEA